LRFDVGLHVINVQLTNFHNMKASTFRIAVVTNSN